MSEEKKVAIVTGASRGIGRFTVKALVDAGFRVTASARNKEQLDSLREEIDPTGALVMAVSCDVRNSKDVKKTVDETVAKWGRVDVLVNNAGLGTFGMVEDYPEEDWEMLYDTNVKGPFLFSKAVIPHMEKAGGGTIIMVSSVASRFINPGLAAYASTKWALNGFAGCLGLEVRDKGIQVTLIEPGSVNTHFHDPHDQGDGDLMPQVVRADSRGDCRRHRRDRQPPAQHLGPRDHDYPAPDS